MTKKICLKRMILQRPTIGKQHILLSGHVPSLSGKPPLHSFKDEHRPKHGSIKENEIYRSTFLYEIAFSVAK